MEYYKCSLWYIAQLSAHFYIYYIYLIAYVVTISQYSR